MGVPLCDACSLTLLSWVNCLKTSLKSSSLFKKYSIFWSQMVLYSYFLPPKCCRNTVTMTYDTVWCVTWHFSGQNDLKCHSKFFITQPPDNISLTFALRYSIEIFPAQMYPPVEVSSDQEWYYVRFAWHLFSIWAGWPSFRCTPHRHIWWQGMVVTLIQLTSAKHGTNADTNVLSWDVLPH